MKCWKVEKDLKFHGWVMGHGWGSHGGTWESMEDVCMGLKHNSQNITCFEGSGCPGIETCAKPLIEI
jgi:hypothetical protein